MSGKKKKGTEAADQQKVTTRYDRKMEERKRQAEKDKRSDLIFKAGVIVVCVALVAVIVISIGLNVTRKQKALNGTYVSVGSHNLTQLEYDYYYNSSVNNYVNAYSSIMGLLGLDMNKDLEDQAYSEEMSWKDMFDQMAIGQVTEVKVLADEASKVGFEYDDTEEYKAFADNIKTQAELNGTQEADYYKAMFGTYATKENMAPVVREGLLASAYYQQLLQENRPEQKEIDAYYEENKVNWDKTDYRILTMTVQTEEGAEEEEKAEALLTVKKRAEEMMARRKAGEEFETLAMEYAPEAEKENYEDEETEYSLKEGMYSAGAPAQYSEWLYEEGRKEGDITVIEDETGDNVYVVEFIKRYYDKADDENIANTMAAERTRELVDGWKAGYAFDGKGNIKYME